MLIKEDHLLYFEENIPVEYIPSPNYGGNIETTKRKGRDYLIMHYTAGTNIQGAIEELTRADDDPVSAHIVIGRDGRIVQLVPFNLIAFHAGYAHWEKTKYLNHYSIGIELDNDGYLVDHGDQWADPKLKVTYDRDQVYFGICWKPKWHEYWKKYPPIQLDTAMDVARVIVETYGLLDILGHEDIHPEKQDPGPAFPMADFRKELFGLEQPSFTRQKVTHTVTVYKDVDENGFKQGVPPVLPTLHALRRLPKGMPVKKLTTRDPWTRITVKKNDLRKHNFQVDHKIQAWVESKYIQQKKLILDANIYADSDKAPVKLHPVNYDGPIYSGDEVQVFYQSKGWALVRTIHPNKFIQGWVDYDFAK